jgi:DNA-binding NarL/FixJ family response regulator
MNGDDSSVPAARAPDALRQLARSRLPVRSDYEPCGEGSDARDSKEKNKGLKLRILVADDQEAVRRRVCSTLAARSDFQVCGEAGNGQEAVEKTKALSPDLVILDITMPLMNGLDAARAIHSFSPNTPIIILSVHKSKQLVEEARRIGVSGYVTKEDAVQKLILAADAVLRDQTFFPADI